MFTQDQKDKWLARLRDPKAVQHRKGYADTSSLYSDANLMPRCCIAHFAYAMTGRTHVLVSDEFNMWQNLEAIPHPTKKKSSFKDYLVECNDVHKMTLPQIADIVENLLPVKG